MPTEIQLLNQKEYNRDMLAKTLEFNRATSQANAQMRMAADQYNANAEDRMIATNAANRAARRNAIREQIAGLGENLGAIGTEQRWMDLAPKLYGYSATGEYINKDKNNPTSDNSVISLLEDSMSKIPAKAWSKRNRKSKGGKEWLIIHHKIDHPLQSLLRYQCKRFYIQPRCWHNGILRLKEYQAEQDKAI